MLKLYSTLGRTARVFKPLKPPAVTVYSCGPTVYNYPHIGNMRKYIADDVLTRLLAVRGYQVRRVINITDVGHLTQDDFDSGEDKIVAAARKEGKSPLAIAEFYTRAFLEDSRLLNLVPPESYVRATDHIEEMIELNKKLIKRKHAYVIGGSVYFDVQSFPEYGALSGNSLDALRERVRTELKEEAFAEKKHPVDFALWIKADPSHLLQWPSPWGQGYPGWHIECAAMILKHLGPTIDIHTGGEDHIFPHHEDEIAEASGATGKPLASYWLHVRHLFVDGKKMSKRDGTFVRIEDVIKHSYHPLAFRFLVLGAHYRARINFTWKAMAAAQEGWQRYVDTVARLREQQTHATTSAEVPLALRQRLAKIAKDFDSALDDDLGVPRALAALAELIGVANGYVAAHTSLPVTNVLLEHLLAFDQVLGLLPETSAPALDPKDLTELKSKIEAREKARKQKRFSEADAIRKEVAALGFEVRDVPGGVEWIKTKTGQRGRFSL